MNAQSRAFNPEPSVELHIDELVLHGFAPNDRYAIGDAVACELAHVLNEQGVPTSLRSENATDETKGKTFNATHEARPPTIGQQIATAIYQGLGK
jgi:hypothetical protein